jgi:hypothetical protein
VIVPDFISVVQNRLSYHKIQSEVFREDTAPPNCEYVLTYVAYQSWDVVTFMKRAEIQLLRENAIVGSASYESGWGLNFSKFDSTYKKLEGVV